MRKPEGEMKGRRGKRQRGEAAAGTRGERAVPLDPSRVARPPEQRQSPGAVAAQAVGARRLRCSARLRKDDRAADLAPAIEKDAPNPWGKAERKRGERTGRTHWEGKK
ncbi:Os08g0440050 [Oryza sativa Japonica Group]|nr:Os08g0440050 [Oryza sativa Japonica Group]